MKANKTIPQAMRESTPVERILDLRKSASSMKQESGLAQVYAGLEWQYVEYEVETTFIKETALERVEVPLEGLWQ